MSGLARHFASRGNTSPAPDPFDRVYREAYAWRTANISDPKMVPFPASLPEEEQKRFVREAKKTPVPDGSKYLEKAIDLLITRGKRQASTDLRKPHRDTFPDGLTLQEAEDLTVKAMQELERLNHLGMNYDRSLMVQQLESIADRARQSMDVRAEAHVLLKLAKMKGYLDVVDDDIGSQLMDVIDMVARANRSEDLEDDEI